MIIDSGQHPFFRGIVLPQKGQNLSALRIRASLYTQIPVVQNLRIRRYSDFLSGKSDCRIVNPVGNPHTSCNKCQHQTDSDNPPPVLTQSLLSLFLQLFSTPHHFDLRFSIPLSSEGALLLCALLPVPSAHNRFFPLNCPACTAYGSAFLQYYEHIHTLFRNLTLSSVLLAHFSIPAAPALLGFLSLRACWSNTPGSRECVLV